MWVSYFVKMSISDCANIGNIYDLFQGDEKDIIMLQNEHLLKPLKRCRKNNCRTQLMLRRQISLKGSYGAYCKKCKRFQSLTRNTFFENTSLSFKFIFVLLWTWACHISPRATSQVTELNRNTIYQYYRYFRDVASWKLLSSEQPQFGGMGVIVHIGKSAILKRKNKRGIIRENWGLGIYDTEKKTGTIFYIVKKKKQTVVSLIRQFVAEGSIICTDGWSAYKALQHYGFQHHIASHSRDFLSNAGPCVNGVEAYWRKLKRFCLQANVLQSCLMSEHIDEFMYREYYKGSDNRVAKNIFNSMLQHIKEKYVV